MDTSPALPQLEGAILATTRYLAAIEDLTDDDVRMPSALPGWTRAHVITHLSRNADALTNLLHWAQTGVESPMYPDQETRDAEIEAGAGRDANALIEDAAASAGRFLQAANELHSSRLDAPVTRVPGDAPFPVRKVGGMRRTEVEVHHADLLLGYTAADWPADFVSHILDRVARDRADGPAMTLQAVDTGQEWQYDGSGGPKITGRSPELAWWVLGRGKGEGLTSSSGELPRLGRWR